MREEIRLVGGDWSAARAESHLTRSTVTAPLLRVRVLLPELDEAAQHAVRTVYGMQAADKYGRAPGRPGNGHSKPPTT
ncbi:hypothetical protein ACFWOS_25325 [Streptomyces rubiginosohelvolus]|uniref:hypothetical protein n=1 Tax=Streptomyces rubiginosohelvolus TaxID=67362 RepID=UPI0036535D8B